MVGKADAVVTEAAKVKDDVVYCAVGELRKPLFLCFNVFAEQSVFC
jgi:hypothetical protein